MPGNTRRLDAWPQGRASGSWPGWLAAATLAAVVAGCSPWNGGLETGLGQDGASSTVAPASTGTPPASTLAPGIPFDSDARVLFDYQAYWADAVAGRRIVEIIDDTGTIRASERNEVEGTANPQEQTCNPHIECYFDAGQFVQAEAFQSSGASLSIQDYPFSNIWTATWRGPA